MDVDEDGDNDLVVSLFLSQQVGVFWNHGYEEQIGDYLLTYTSEGGLSGSIYGVTALSVIDYDHDGHSDLVATSEADPRQAVILRNRRGEATPVTGFAVAQTLGYGRTWSGSVICDLDQNGQEDILLLPRAGVPGMYMGTGTSQPGESAMYRDLGYTLGLRAGKNPGSVTSGGVCADFNDDVFPDIYMGRIKADPFLYRSVQPGSVAGGSPNALLKKLLVKLSTVGNSNESLIGTVVTVTAEGKSWSRTIDGGSGRGGQDSNQLLFGLGSLSGDAVNIDVEYPSGDTDHVTGFALSGEVWTAVEDGVPTIKAGTKQAPDPTYAYELSPGGHDIVFKWKTIGIKGDLRQDMVAVENHLGYSEGGPCYGGIPAGAPELLTWDRPDVEVQVYWDGTDWQHVLRWLGRPCVNTPGCQHRFMVTSGIGNGETVSRGWTLMNQSPFCIPVED
jgi:hypothetical protein